ncbi:hypothetical protein HJC23_006808 [Cyclotella cryptica]|uniref:Uncharacterized protein n=1 Tax=Cyclotella cryptica TaxID=29204 RepID=A0ABD3PFS3_9STRA
MYYEPEKLSPGQIADAALHGLSSSGNAAAIPLHNNVIFAVSPHGSLFPITRHSREAPRCLCWREGASVCWTSKYGTSKVDRFDVTD